MRYDHIWASTCSFNEAGYNAGRVAVLEKAYAAEKRARQSDAALATATIVELERLLQNLLTAVGPQSWDEDAVRTRDRDITHPPTHGLD